MSPPSDTAGPKPSAPSVPSEDSLRRARGRFYAAAFLVDAVGWGHALLVAAVAEERFGARPETLGYLGASVNLFYALSSLLVGRLSDRIGSGPILRVSLGVLAGVVLPATMLVDTLPALFLATIAAGVALGAYWPAFERELSFLSPGRSLWKSIGAFNLAWAGGAALGEWGAPVVFARSGFTAGLVACAVAIAAALVCLAPRAPLRVRASSPEARGESPMPPPTAAPPANTASLVTAARIANFATAFTLGAFSFFFLRVARASGIAYELAGALLLVRDAARLMAFIVLRSSRRWQGSIVLLLGLQLAAGGALVCCGIFPSPGVLFVLLPVFGLFSGLSYYSSLLYGLSMRFNEGGHSGLHESVMACGRFASPLLCGLVGAAFPASPGAVLVFVGCVLVVLVPLEWRTCPPPARGAT